MIQGSVVFKKETAVFVKLLLVIWNRVVFIKSAIRYRQGQDKNQSRGQSRGKDSSQDRVQGTVQSNNEATSQDNSQSTGQGKRS